MSKSTVARARGYGQFGWPPEWSHPAVPRSEVAATDLVIQCRRRFEIMQENLRRCRAARGRHAARRWARVMMRSGSARIAVMDAACRHKKLKWNSLAIVRAGLSLDLTRRTKEEVLMDLVEKSNGSFRVVYDFGPREYARQRLAYVACKNSEQFPGQMFMHCGGVPAAAAWLNANITSKTVVTVTDIPNAFWVLNREHLEADGLLSKPVMQSVLYDAQSVGRRRADIPLKGGSIASVLEDRVYSENRTPTGRGIPPGSALASLLAEYRIWKVLAAVQALLPGVIFGVYLDNIIFLSANVKEARTATNALLKAMLDEFGSEVADEVRARKRTSLAASEAGFYYLGDHYRYRSGRLHRRMTESTADLFSARLAQRIQIEGLSVPTIHRSVGGWARQRSYDPRAFEFALEILDDLGVPYKDSEVAPQP